MGLGVPPMRKDLALPEVETRHIDLLYEKLASSERCEWVEAVLTRKQHEDEGKELTGEKKKLTEGKKLLEKTYGKDHMFFALRDKCVEFEAGQYKYKVCFFGKATRPESIEDENLETIM
ncbi:hypothetical protein PI124_g11617 [Phytophthora idaei]|nr:hypothetical protein PI124_g11617 [Phytophthora idaei]